MSRAFLLVLISNAFVGVLINKEDSIFLIGNDPKQSAEQHPTP
jgi:hypothetical protein